MRILALRLANLASLPGPLEIDFTAPPLRDVGLFAITGPTGAGKSTLLDALCLALYGSTPRLRQAPRQGSQIDDTADSTLITSDPRTLLRRGTASGHAEVDFLGRDGRRYRARWAVRRARDRATGRLQAAEQSLRDLDGDRLLTTQKREFDRLLEERLGLGFEQFTRAVLLAQSEFAAFLRADDNERSDLLERLTGTSEYTAVSIAAYRRASDARKAVEGLEARLADDLPADADARAELERLAREAEDLLGTLREDANRLDARQQWHATDERLCQAHAEGLSQWQDAETHWRDLACARADREWRRLIAPQRHRLIRQAELPGEFAERQAVHARIQQALDAARAALQTAEERRDRAERALADADDERRQAEPSLRAARDSAQRLATLEKQLTDLATRQRERQQQADRLAAQRRQAESDQHRHQRQRDEWQTTLQRLMGDHPRLDSARQAVQRTHDQAARRALDLNELAAAWREAGRADEAHLQLGERIRDDERRQARLLEAGKAARQRLDEADGRYRTVRDLIERGRAVRSASVATLRETLREDEPCPVCGGLDHPWRHHPPQTPEAAQLAAQRAEEDRQLAQAESERDQARQRRDELLGEYRAVDAALAQHRLDLQRVEQRLTDARRRLADHPLHAELAAIDDAERSAWLAHRQQESDAARRHAERTLEELARAEAELAPLEEALRQGELRLAQLDAQRLGLDEELAQLAERLPPLHRQSDELAAELAALLGEHPSADAWQQHLDDRRDAARQARDSALEAFHSAARERERLTQQARHEAERLAQLERESDALNRELSEWRQAHPALDDATLARLLAQPQEEADRQDRALADADEALQRGQASLAERRLALTRHRRDRLPAIADEGDDALLGDEIDAELQHQRETLASERDALTPRLEDAQRNRDEAVHALRDDDRRRERQRENQAELEAARAEHHRWGQISELIGSADGKTFRRIAQAYNLEQLLEHANQHLAGLSRRYRLARGGSPLGLLVVDHDMGDERRSVHSLSGGETFLVSLALALGLASMASGELTIESLFIDEGFGSLDPQSLALAMEALDGLQALGRRVGVISHVQEMHERIPVQIRVEPQGNGTSRARLVGA